MKSISYLCLLATFCCHISAHHGFSGSYESDEAGPFNPNDIIGTGAVSSSITDENGGSQKSVQIFPLRRSRRSAHIGFGLHPVNVRPVYVQPAIQPVALAPAGPIQYQGYQHLHPRTVIANPNTQSQSQAISASFGNNHLNGGGSSISAAAASSSGGGGNPSIQLVRK